MFLVRCAFWLSVVIMLLPAEPEKNNTKVSSVQNNLTTGQAIIAAQSTMVDLSGFCQRNQAACETGRAAIDVFIQKAQYGAGLLNEWVGGISSANAATIKPVDLSDYQLSTGANPSQIQLAANNTPASQQTLTKEDLSPAWGGPLIKTRA